ncbi:MAG: strawberry notch C-terminal domain-containing protein [Cyclobacteriaceae bacterium]
MIEQAQMTTTEVDKNDFTIGQSEARKMALEQSELVKYVPKSQASHNFNCLIPRNIAFEVQKALNNLVKAKGNIDIYVRQTLKYPTNEQMWKGFSAEQVDGIGLYLKNFELNQGLIIGDQTGTGKGRQAAAVIRHAVLNNMIPVFFTKSSNLFSDIYRDLVNIGHPNINPLILNTDQQAKVRDQNGLMMYSQPSASKLKALLSNIIEVPSHGHESKEWHGKREKPLPKKVGTIELTTARDKMPEEYDMVFLTYSQVQAAAPYKKEWLMELAKAGGSGDKGCKPLVFILDESHLAGGYDTKIGEWIREALKHVRACCYLSATFAKTPAVMPLYKQKTAISELNLNDEGFVEAMEKGGLSLQEICASNLAENGQLISRVRSREGINTDYIVIDEEPARSKNRQQVDTILEIMREIVEFEKTYLQPEFDAIRESAKMNGGEGNATAKGLGVKQSPYFSRVFNIIDQLIFSVNIQAVADKTIELLNQDKKVVIAFKSTMGSYLSDFKLKDGDIFPDSELEFARTLTKGLDGIFRYSIKDFEGEITRFRIEIENLSADAQSAYKAIKQKISLVETGLTISPIDQLIQLIETQIKSSRLGGHPGDNFIVSEVTARNQRIDLVGGENIIRSMKPDVGSSFRSFNNGNVDVLLINQSGSTGASAHASAKFADQRQRVMIMLQMELDINLEVQKWGRIDRADQVILPEYIYMIADIPVVKRFMTMLKGKLKKLDANTTGSQNTKDESFQSDDFFNKYGDRVAWTYIRENHDLREELGWPTYQKKWDWDEGGWFWEDKDSLDGSMRTLTGRLGLIEVARQDQVYEQLLERYEQLIAYEKENGTYDLVTEFQPLDAEVISRELHEMGMGGKSPFGRDAIREVSIINNLNKPYTKKELDVKLTGKLEGRSPELAQSELIEKIKTGMAEVFAARFQKIEQNYEKMFAEYEGMPWSDEGGDEENTKRLRFKKIKAHDRCQAVLDKKIEIEKEHEQIQKTILQRVAYWQVGTPVHVPLPFGVEVSAGVFLGVFINQSNANPYTLGNVLFKFATVDSRRVVSYNLTPDQLSRISLIYTSSKDLTAKERSEILTDWDHLTKEASANREKRIILTENILASAKNLGGGNKLIKYNTKTGLIRNGIIMRRGFEKEDDGMLALFPIGKAIDIIKALDIEEEFADTKNAVRFKKLEGAFYRISIKKSGNYSLYTDNSLRWLLVNPTHTEEEEPPDFVQNGGDMTGTIHVKKLEQFLEILSVKGFQYLDKPRVWTQTEWEEEQGLNPPVPNITNQKTFQYELSKPFGQGSNPEKGFIEHTEKSKGFPFGIAIFNRKLTPKEKYSYSLIPIYHNPDQLYTDWKYEISNGALSDDYELLIKEAKKVELHRAIEMIGRYITTNSHEDGNAEFVFGRYDVYELGRFAYQEEIAVIEAVDDLITSLQIELQLTN